MERKATKDATKEAIEQSGSAGYSHSGCGSRSSHGSHSGGCGSAVGTLKALN